MIYYASMSIIAKYNREIKLIYKYTWLESVIPNMAWVNRVEFKNVFDAIPKIIAPPKLPNFHILVSMDTDAPSQNMAQISVTDGLLNWKMN